MVVVKSNAQQSKKS